MFNTWPRLLQHLRRRVDPSTISPGDVLAWDGDDFAPTAGGGGGPETDPIAIHPGETLTETTGDDGGVAYESPNNVPIFAFRIEGDAFDRLKIWPGQIGLGYGPEEINAILSMDGGGNLSIDVLAGGGLALRAPLGYVSMGSPTGTLSFFGASSVAQPAAIADIADPTNATAADVANKVNALAAALRALGLIAT